MKPDIFILSAQVMINLLSGIQSLNEDIVDDYEIISDLMAQDVRDKLGEEYEVWDITKDEFEQRIKPKIK
ncbi:hypothetical protein NGI46_24970 [Peribacillus butanolivorans]|uniref:hypothetical protein n=1 Tax=Peribacillus butanolivorans TaxID=421767 RepID=UPI00207C822C|nr:hypothetical protein [Peribacillus butanolivorans]MCO0600597.1 hypothetical protein [Peribacillus butanolivorans]